MFPISTTGLFLYFLKTSENQRFSDVFEGSENRPVAWNGLTRPVNVIVLFVEFQSSI